MIYPNGDESAYVATVSEATVAAGVPRPDGDETSEVRCFLPQELPAAEMGRLTRALFSDLGMLTIQTVPTCSGSAASSTEVLALVLSHP